MIAAAAKSMRFDNFLSTPSDICVLSKRLRALAVPRGIQNPKFHSPSALVWQSPVWRVLHFTSCSACERGVCLSGGIRSHLVTLAKTLIKLWDKAQGAEVRSDNLLCAAGKHLAKMQFITERVAKLVFFVLSFSADFCRNVTWEIVGWLL